MLSLQSTSLQENVSSSLYGISINTDRAESPTGTAMSLVLNWCHRSLLPPVDVMRQFLHISWHEECCAHVEWNADIRVGLLEPIHSCRKLVVELQENTKNY